MKEKLYMNPKTGSTGEYDDWYYTNQDGEEVNAVDLGEVVEVDNSEDNEIHKRKGLG